MLVTATNLLAAGLALALFNLVARSRALLALLNLAAALGFAALLASTL